MKMVFKGTIRDIVIYKQSLTVSNAVSHQRNQMSMVYPTNDLYLNTKFSFSLPTTHLELFNCHHFPI